MKQSYTEQLQQELVQVFGHPVLSYSDCVKLAEEIYEKTGSKISVNTLRRFFNLIKATYPPSYNTLTILSKACGFQSYSEFTLLCESNADRPNAALLNYMVLLFQQLPVPGLSDETFNNLVRLTITYLKTNRNITDAFQKRIARTRNGQQFYFERFINTDALDSFYGNGLRYYLNERKDTEAQVFGHGLLCFRYWLAANRPAFDSHYKKIHPYIESSSLPYPLQARGMAAALFHAHLHQLPAEPLLETARAKFNQLAPGKEASKTLPHFEYIITGALVLTCHFEQALFYINQARKKRYRHALPEAELVLFRGFDVYEAVAWAGLGKKVKAQAAYERIAGAKFYFLEQQYFSILVMQVERLLNKRAFREEKLQYLINETGFKGLQQLKG